VTLRVIHDPKAREFFADLDGQRPVLQYRYADGLMTIVHIGVPAALSNRGITAELTPTALEFARGQGWKVHPGCSYARAFIAQHPQYADLMDRGTVTGPR
jgi:hypothetical protein